MSLSWRKSRLLALLGLFALLPGAALGHEWNCDMQKIDQQKSPDYKQKNEDQEKEKGFKLKANSCYRSESAQRAACINVCGNPGGCPGSCAPPGKSNHQKVAAADIGGIPGSVEAGCKYLFDLCQTMRAENPGNGCEIGGYGPGTHHFAFGPIKNSAYNKCSFLKSQMGQDPSAWKKQKQSGDDLYNQVMGGGGSPPMPGGGGSGGGSSGEGGSAGYPRDAREHMRPTPTPNFGSSGASASRKISRPDFKPQEESDGANKTTKIGAGTQEGVSDITQGAAGGFGGGSLGSGGSWASDGHDFSGASSLGKGAGLPPGNWSGASSDNLPSGGGSAEGPAKPGSAKGGTHEVISSFTSAGGVGGLGNSKLGVSGAEVNSAMKSLAQDFGPSLGERGPASLEGEESQAGAATGPEGASLFDRCRAAHLRCLKGGCVTAY